jgi:hypothetical protein
MTEITEFSSDDIDALDEAKMVVNLFGKPTTWVWTFAGPGHPKTVEISDRDARARLSLERERDEARINGRTWVEPEETVAGLRQKNVKTVVDRLLSWSPVKIDGQELPFSVDAATKLLLDPRKVDLYLQAMKFLGGERSFTKASAGG